MGIQITNNGGINCKIVTVLLRSSDINFPTCFPLWLPIPTIYFLKLLKHHFHLHWIFFDGMKEWILKLMKKVIYLGLFWKPLWLYVLLTHLGWQNQNATGICGKKRHLQRPPRILQRMQNSREDEDDEHTDNIEKVARQLSRL